MKGIPQQQGFDYGQPPSIIPPAIAKDQTTVEPIPVKTETAQDSSQENDEEEDTKPSLPVSSVNKPQNSVNPSVPAEVKQSIKKVEDGPDMDYQAAHDDYGLAELERRMEMSRSEADKYLAAAANIQMAGNVTGHQNNTEGLRALASNELGKAQDYKTLIDEQRREMDQDIKADIADTGYTKAAMELGVEKERANPDSSVSKGARAVLSSLGQQFKIDLPPELASMSHQDMMADPNLKQFDSVIKSQIMGEARKEATQARMQQQSDALRMRLEMQQQAKQQRQDQIDDQAMRNLRKDMETSSASSRQAIGRQQAIVDSADRLQEFIGDALKNPDKLNNIQIAEISRVVDGMMSNGASTIGGMTKLTPTTAGGDLAKIQQYLTGELTGSNQGEFVKQFVAATQREKAMAQAKINAFHSRTLSGYPGLAQRRPQDVNSLINEFNRGSAETLPQTTKSSSNPTPGMVRVIGPKGTFDVPQDKAQQLVEKFGYEVVQ